jgi:hypothetical protein
MNLGVLAIPETWLPLDSAPKDGRVIALTAFESDGSLYEVHPMQWAHIQRNRLFPGRTGMWTAPGGEYTWNDDGHGGGPTHWLPLEVYECHLALTAQGIEARSGATVQQGAIRRTKARWRSRCAQGAAMKQIIARSPKGHVTIEDVILVARARQAIRERVEEVVVGVAPLRGPLTCASHGAESSFVSTAAAAAIANAREDA